jgi:hypothetical protein
MTARGNGALRGVSTPATMPGQTGGVVAAYRARPGDADVPKFMDIHTGMVGITPEALKKAHEGDLAIQGDENVSFDHAWADPVSGTVFCISTAPDADAVQRIHTRNGIPPAEIHEITMEV